MPVGHPEYPAWGAVACSKMKDYPFKYSNHWEMECYDCDSWRLLVYWDGGRGYGDWEGTSYDVITTTGLETKAGVYYCGLHRLSELSEKDCVHMIDQHDPRILQHGGRWIDGGTWTEL